MVLEQRFLWVISINDNYSTLWIYLYNWLFETWLIPLCTSCILQWCGPLRSKNSLPGTSVVDSVPKLLLIALDRHSATCCRQLLPLLVVPEVSVPWFPSGSGCPEQVHVKIIAVAWNGEVLPHLKGYSWSLRSSPWARAWRLLLFGLQ